MISYLDNIILFLFRYSLGTIIYISFNHSKELDIFHSTLMTLEFIYTHIKHMTVFDMCVSISQRRIIYKQRINSTTAEILDAYKCESLERHREGKTFLVFPRESCTEADHSSTGVTQHYGHHLSGSLHPEATKYGTTLLK